MYTVLGPHQDVPMNAEGAGRWHCQSYLKALGNWEKENVISIFKNSKKEDPGNYKTVSLTLIPEGNNPGNHFQM